MISYEKSEALVPYIVFIFCESSEQEVELRIAIEEINKHLNSKKILLELFTCSAMLKIKSGLCANSYKEYLVNYIKCARYCLTEEIWEELGIYEFETNISEVSTYIMDFDNVVRRDFNNEIKTNYGEMKAVFCWDNKSDIRQDFPKRLNGLTKTDKVYFSFPHKIIKAGFTALSPNVMSRIFLLIFKTNCLGPEYSHTNHRLLSFYYADQISLLTALREIKDNLPEQYEQYVGWIDCESSALVSLNQSRNPSIWMPKGLNI